MDELLARVKRASSDIKAACAVPVAVFDFAVRAFAQGEARAFCETCDRAKRGACDFRMAHTYGCFEAERWNGLYVYYCPMSLAFVATVVFEKKLAAYALVAGPLVMGQLEDAAADEPGMAQAVSRLKQLTPGEVSALSRVLWMASMYLSGRGEGDAGEAARAQTQLMGSLYEVTGRMYASGARYPLEIEQRLQRMIARGDKQGAQELINELLGTLYFASAGDFPLIKERAKELIVLFSRASAEGGADVNRIFGQTRDLQAEIDHFHTLDELSLFLTSIFYRFVGYVFDFGQFEHADIMHKAISYLRENLGGRLSLEDLAQHVGLSRSYLSTIFKSELGLTFTDYLNRMRVEKSRELLLNPALTLADIASLVGYSDQSYFTKKFVQLTGQSPGQYRKKRGRNEKDDQ